MKCKFFCKNLIVLGIVLTTVLFFVFSANAVNDEETQNNAADTVTQENTIETESIVETEAPTEVPTEPETETPAEPETYYEPETDEPREIEPQYDDNDNSYETQEPENYEPDNEEVTAAKKTLPTIAPTTAPKEKTEGDYTYGYASWACVASGILVLAAIMISTVGSGKNKKKRK